MEINENQDWWYWDEGVQHTTDGCILLRENTEELCAAIEGGEWASTRPDEAKCVETKKCFNGDWFNNMVKSECEKCENEYEPVNDWHGNTWNSGNMRSLFTWKQKVRRSGSRSSLHFLCDVYF